MFVTTLVEPHPIFMKILGKSLDDLRGRMRLKIVSKIKF